MLILACALPCSAEEAPRGPAVASVTVSGAASLKPGELEAVLPLRRGSPYGPAERDLLRDVVLSFYQARGYLEAAAVISESGDKDEVTLLVSVTEGRRYVFGATSFKGLEKLTHRTLARELEYSEGEPYEYSRVMASLGRLQGLGWFEKLGVLVSSSPAGAMDVAFDLREHPMLWLKGGVGYGSEERERLSLGLAQNNFLGRGYKAELTGSLSSIWLEYRADFVNRHFLASRTELSNTSSWRRERRDGYSMETAKTAVGLGRSLAEFLRGSVTYRLQRNLIYRVAPGVSAYAPGLSRTRSLSLALNRDTSDEPFYPSRGTRSEFLLERSGGLWGGDIDFYKTHLGATAYLSAWRGTVIVLSARGGFVRETGDTAEVPIFERFFSGGANSIRGYAERAVGPEDAEGNPIGGRVTAGANAEFRFPVYKKLRGALFADGGQSALSTSGVDPSRWKMGAGFGLRYRTPVGPLRADFGYKLNPGADPSDGRWRIHLTLGESF
ncbi:MAG: outer membrane protein [Elusimicrobia bacterium]|nr:MAG: outer membrane protein [Elusimicrobiota bacterium]KAF0154049.1 MAG: outer membrane protein [Elusimicrobiota bacterium]